jgi:hypothetical protein
MSEQQLLDRVAAKIFNVPGAAEVYEREIALGRVGTPQDFADTFFGWRSPLHHGRESAS